MLAQSLVPVFFAAATLLFRHGAASIVSVPTGSAKSGHMTNEEALNFFQGLHEQFPDWVTPPIVIGKSVEHRSIYAICLGNCVDDDTPGLLMTGLHHAREPMGMTVSISTLTCWNHSMQ